MDGTCHGGRSDPHLQIHDVALNVCINLIHGRDRIPLDHLHQCDEHSGVSQHGKDHEGGMHGGFLVRDDPCDANRQQHVDGYVVIDPCLCNIRPQLLFSA